MTNRTHRLLLVAAVCVLALAVPAPAQDTNNQFTGTWFHYVAGGGPNLVTIHSDGTLTVTSAWLFGGGAGDLWPFRVSPIHAVWEKVGPKDVLVTSFLLLFDAPGNIVALQRNSCRLQLGADRDTYTGAEVMERASCSAADPWMATTGPSVFGCPNPVDPDTVWVPDPGMPPGGYPVTAYRVKVVPH